MYPIFKFDKPQSEVYQIITKYNHKTLSSYMRDNGLNKLIITSNEDDHKGWNEPILPDLKEFDFIEELLVYWTNIQDIEGIHSCINIRTLWLDNNDKTAIDFSKFTYLEKFVSWERKNIKNIWGVSTLKNLTVAGLKKHHFSQGIALDSIEKLRILNTALVDISFIANGKNITYLELLGMTKLTDLQDLKELIKLKHLRIGANKVRDFSFIKNLYNLEYLYVSSKVAEFKVEYFKHLNNIKKMNLSGNSDIAAFNNKLLKQMW